MLSGEDAVLAAPTDPAEAVRHADADALLTTENRADVDLGARVDQRVARIAGEEFRALALQDFCDNVCAIHMENLMFAILFDRGTRGWRPK